MKALLSFEGSLSKPPTEARATVSGSTLLTLKKDHQNLQNNTLLVIIKVLMKVLIKDLNKDLFRRSVVIDP